MDIWMHVDHMACYNVGQWFKGMISRLHTSEPQDNDVQNVQKTQWAAEWARLNSQFQASHREHMIAANEPCSDRFFKGFTWKWAKEKRFEV